MSVIPVKTPSRHYSIHLFREDFARSARIIREHLSENRVYIITDKTVSRLYRGKIEKIFGRFFETVWLTISDGERHKNLITCEKLLTQLSRLGAHRKSMILALGGGVAGDIAGFVASIYMRGIDFIQMPTTLLAQVDSSVGGKTGVDLSTGKNLAGRFHQPRAVLIHTTFLKTLPAREFRCGMAEVIKYGMIADAGFFSWLEQNAPLIKKRSHKALERIITTSCRIKSKIVGQDETESGRRTMLNFGHTLAHAVETLTGYRQYNHGEAVAIGMVYATRLSNATGVCKRDESLHLIALLKKFGLPREIPSLPKSKYLSVMRRDKKSGGASLKFILLEKIGKVKTQNLSLEVIGQCL